LGNSIAILLLIIVLYAVIAEWLGRRSITMPMFFLAVVLFADTSTLSVHQLMADAGLPARLLLLALPVIIALDGLLAFVFFPEERLAVCWRHSPPTDLPGNRAARHTGAGAGDLFRFGCVGRQRIYRRLRGRAVLQIHYPPPAASRRRI
jgi:hypothetical protein